MGKATPALDLPDPLKQTGKPPAPGKPAPADIGLGATDDLLAQLAGSEIDRLLAEAEVEGSSDESPPPPMESPALSLSSEPAVEPTSDFLLQKPADDTFKLNESPAPTTDVAISATARVESQEEAKPDESLVAHEVLPELASDQSPVDAAQGEVGAELESLFAKLQLSDLKFKEVTADEDEPESAPTPEPERASAPVQEVSQIAPAKTSTTREIDSSSAVAAELEADEAQHRIPQKAAPTVAQKPAPSTSPAPAPAPSAQNSEPTLPILLRLLLWINAPFSSLPEAIRNALGQIAIVTTVNAVAVLLYVWLFRARH